MFHPKSIVQHCHHLHQVASLAALPLLVTALSDCPATQDSWLWINKILTYVQLLLSTIMTMNYYVIRKQILFSLQVEYTHWFPSWAPNVTSILASCRLLLRTATSSGDSPSLFTLKINK
jgi:hypothetical protein